MTQTRSILADQTLQRLRYFARGGRVDAVKLSVVRDDVRAALDRIDALRAALKGCGQAQHIGRICCPESLCWECATKRRSATSMLLTGTPDGE